MPSTSRLNFRDSPAPVPSAMYGILTFNKGQAPTAEFRAELGKYGRGSACTGCRISRVKCSGKLDGTDCDRCKRLEMPCQYTNSQNRRHRRNSPHPDSSRKGGTSTDSRFSKHSNSNSHSSGVTSSPPDLLNWNEGQLTTDEPLEFDFGAWLQSHSLPSSPLIAEPLQHGPQIDSVITPPYLDFLCSVQPEQLQRGRDKGDDSLAWFCGVGKHESGKSATAGHEPASFKVFPQHQDGPSKGQESIKFQCKCHKETTSLLSVVRGWGLGGGPGAGLGISADGTIINCTRIVEFLTLFEASIMQLNMVERCSQACILSQDLVILLLLVVKQLAKLLLSLAADFTGASSGSPISPTDISHPWTSRNSIPKRQVVPSARIGSFEIQDPFDLRMIMRLLLQIRAQVLDTYICRWSHNIKDYGLKSLEMNLRKIQKDLNEMAGGGPRRVEGLHLI